MATYRVAPNAARQLISLQLSFSTADQERMVFFSRVGQPAASPAVVILEVPSAQQEPSVLDPESPQPRRPDANLRVTAINGAIVAIDPGSPPEAVPLDEAAGLLNLG